MILMPLNPSQQNTVEKIQGPCLVIAGAGTGKTKTIVEKLAYLVKQGADPSRILALTFSIEAARSLKEKAEELCPAAREMHISTFHSFCAEFIRDHDVKCDVREQFKILEELDAAILLKRKLGRDMFLGIEYAYYHRGLEPEVRAHDKIDIARYHPVEKFLPHLAFHHGFVA